MHDNNGRNSNNSDNEIDDFDDKENDQIHTNTIFFIYQFLRLLGFDSRLFVNISLLRQYFDHYYGNSVYCWVVLDCNWL